ncbi:MAG: hypothetical protein DMF84_23370 [Acidobacteria bacterium]|nr:MAG: hypothetical protein DMF84_23370 [Acidobacteriota bacterium]
MQDDAPIGRQRRRAVVFDDEYHVRRTGDWRTYPAPPALALIGERWLRESRTAMLSVPSVVIPHERNFILNPGHAEFAAFQVGPAEPLSFDPRMWKRKG